MLKHNNKDFVSLKTYCVVPESINTLPMEGHWKFLRKGEGVLKAKLLEEGAKQKAFCGRSMEQHIVNDDNGCI